MCTLRILILYYVCLLGLISCKPLNSDKKNTTDRTFNGEYTGEYLNRIAFPLGGIGAGMVCLEGTGAFSHVSVRNAPDVFNEPLIFAALSIKGKENKARVLEGPVPQWKAFGNPGAGNGGGQSSWGLPRFEKATFLARFPSVTVKLTDRDMPVGVSIQGWSPFIPGNPDDSSLPVAGLEYTFTNTGSVDIEALFSFHSANFIKKGSGNHSIRSCTGGFILHQDSTSKEPWTQGDFAIVTDRTDVMVDHCWFRGGWWDPLTMTWNHVKEMQTVENQPIENGAPGASLYVPVSLAGKETKTIRVMFSWYVPVSNLRLGKDPEGTPPDNPVSGCCSSPWYQPWYSGKFKNIRDVVDYWSNNYSDLKKKSELFLTAFYTSSLPPEVIEAVAANLTILKSPTVLRQKDGRLWAWEGCSDRSGCCEGSCTHVWNYAQAIPHIFPSLERTLRETEFEISQDESGHQAFRSALPIRPKTHDFHAAADGQLGGIMKVYRDWRISGDNKWLRELYPLVKASMDYCIHTWDPRHTGTLEEPHHNTYDIEFWGPDGMCTSFYLGALLSISEMGEFLEEDVSDYRKLLGTGKKFMEDSLFEGEYFYQRIKWKGLSAPDPVEMSKNQWNSNYSDEAKILLEKEGPKYQYGNGCLSDGVLGLWMTGVCGLNTPVEESMVKSHLNAVYKYNLRHDLSNHANPQRPTYALGNEGGLLLCTWPKGGKLSLPFVYSDEVWTGIEYQVASHLMLAGEVDKGLDIVRTARKRYDGRVRNPFNEYECGHWYARAMSSYGLLQGLTGVRYDAVDQTLYIDSKIGDFQSFLSTSTGFGNVGLKNGKPYVKMVYGDLPVKKCVVSGSQTSIE
jgi:uncharacterized protein (DUF608 family)